jgi:hypothetical protein
MPVVPCLILFGPYFTLVSVSLPCPNSFLGGFPTCSVPDPDTAERHPPPLDVRMHSCDLRSGRSSTLESCPVSSDSYEVGFMDSYYVTRVVSVSTMQGGFAARGSGARIRRTSFPRAGTILEIRILRPADDG